MRRIYVDEKWCLGCHLCEYNCAFANSHEKDFIKALKNKKISPRIQIEESQNISFAVQCRHCSEPLCVKSCITGAFSVNDGIIKIDKERCIGCYTCVLVCPYGCVLPSDDGPMQKCELCTDNAGGEPACVKGCPNRAIIFEER
jgi:carbon-monoxide dehydrogenase iron sulfur subunit